MRYLNRLADILEGYAESGLAAVLALIALLWSSFK